MKIADLEVIDPFRVPRQEFRFGGEIVETTAIQTLTRITTDDGASFVQIGLPSGEARRANGPGRAIPVFSSSNPPKVRIGGCHASDPSKDGGARRDPFHEHR
jgi:hypothetical protein